MIVQRLRSSSRRGRFLSTKGNSNSNQAKKYTGNGILGIVREDYGMWERRAPLIPSQVKILLAPGDIKVLIQPCNRRIFSDAEYEAAGAIVQDDISEASLIIGVKKISPKNILPDKSYMFFSHTIKAQPANMGLLDTILERQARLFDYECITTGGRDDSPRLVAFGKYAGYAGMIDCFQGVGIRLLAQGYSNPFLNIPFSFMHPSINDARIVLEQVGREISSKGLPLAMSPLVFTFTGSGNVSKGAREMFELLPHEYVQVAELPTLRQEILDGKRSQNKLYGVLVTARDMVRHKHQPKKSQSLDFDKGHYYANPTQYEPQFHETVLPYTSVLVNGMYWDYRYPRLVTKQQIKELRSKGNHSLLCVADISCDIDGSCEFLTHTTSIEKPFYTYFPESEETCDVVDSHGVLMLGVDILPSELPRDASEYFGTALLPLLPPLLHHPGTVITTTGTGTGTGTGMSELPPELHRACIAAHGQLLPKWTYIARLREQAAVLRTNSAAIEATLRQTGSHLRLLEVEMVGHLFDSGVINDALDLLERAADKVAFSVASCDVRANLTAAAVPSKILLRLSGAEVDVHEVADCITKLVESNAKAEGAVRVHRCHVAADTGAGADVGTNTTTANHYDEQSWGRPAAIVKSMARKRVLLFGSGRVAKPVMRLFHQNDDTHVTIATDDPAQAEDLMSVFRDKSSSNLKSFPYFNSNSSDRVSFQHFRFPEDVNRLPQLIKESDVVISLLPATMHLPIAAEAIRQKRHLVTASYVSPAMLHDLDQPARDAGVMLLNEVGLDPGIDHMLIMQSIDDIHSRGGVVTDMTSLCGGLPDPVAADNPLRYKISWSPRGMLNAALNSARYLRDGAVVEVPGEQLLQAGMKTNYFPTLRLEVLPNRDSLLYRDLYGIPKAKNICRGTLRYEGWSNAMHGLKSLGLFHADPLPGDVDTWRKLLAQPQQQQQQQQQEDVRARLMASGVADIEHVLQAAQWLGILQASSSIGSDSSLRGGSAIDALCKLLEDKLQFQEGEKDMVAMYHRVVGRMPDGSTETHCSRLLAFGDPVGDSAMSATVGYTTAAAAELILQGRLTNRSGVLIPTTRDIYEPMLKRINECGIFWTEDITKTPK